MALQASTLGTLGGARDTRVVQAQLGDAIASVREAIAEMRAMHDVETSMLAFGFVLGADPAGARGARRRRQAPRRQLKPRRTA
jgi:hypothetical protein